jgi:hypothetical protein
VSLTDTTLFPGGLDTFPDIDAAGGDMLNTVGKEHDALHDKASKALAAIEWLLVATSNVVNVMAHGAVDSGLPAVNDAALNAARAAIVATGRPGRVFIPTGVELPVTLGDVIGAGGVDYFGGGKLITTSTSVGAFITFPAGSQHCGADGIVFESPDDRAVGVQVLSSASAMSDDIMVVNCRCIEARLVVTNDLTATSYAAHSTHPTTGTVTRNVTIRGNRGKRTGANFTSFPFIYLWYTIGGEITGNWMDGYGYGLTFWGGDANTAIDGAIANERKCGGFVINNNTALNCLDVLAGGAGTWGSMGFDIIMNDNRVENCADVGIDLEGCLTCTGTGNIANNCANGSLTTFFFSRGVEFTGGSCRRDTPGLIARVMNNSALADNKTVTFNGVTMESPAICRFALETADRATVQNCIFTNVWIDGDIGGFSNNARTTTIDHNNFLFTVASGAALMAIMISRNHLKARVIITRNIVESTVAQPAGSRAVYSYQDDPVNPVLEQINDNTLLGWTEPIETVWNGANAGIGIGTFVCRNVVDVGATIINTRGAASIATGIAPVVVRLHNYDSAGTLVP